MLENKLETNLKLINESVYIKCGLTMSNLELNVEGKTYGASSFELNGYKVEHRTSKITPTKAGQFVTIWKRNKDGVTTPFDISDDIDFVVVTSKSGDQLGQFIFPKDVLIDNGVFSQNGIGGKRGIRVYPSWAIVASKQAERTQCWQTKYFVTIQGDNNEELNLVRRLFATD